MKYLFGSIFMAITMWSQAQQTVELEKQNGAHNIYTDIVIDATPKQVWEVFTDFDSYDDWAVYFKGIKGEIQEGEEITAYFKPDPEKDLNKVDRTLHVTGQKSFSWSGSILLGIKDHHVFLISETEDGKTRFIQTDEVKKGFSFLFGGKIARRMVENYPKFNLSLKEEVEKRY